MALFSTSPPVPPPPPIDCAKIPRENKPSVKSDKALVTITELPSPAAPPSPPMASFADAVPPTPPPPPTDCAKMASARLPLV
ncbi:hypothetical protein D3C80_553690 [compost metagenome]